VSKSSVYRTWLRYTEEFDTLIIYGFPIIFYHPGPPGVTPKGQKYYGKSIDNQRVKIFSVQGLDPVHWRIWHVGYLWISHNIFVPPPGGGEKRGHFLTPFFSLNWPEPDPPKGVTFWPLLGGYPPKGGYPERARKWTPIFPLNTALRDPRKGTPFLTIFTTFCQKMIKNR